MFHKSLLTTQGLLLPIVIEHTRPGDPKRKGSGSARVALPRARLGRNPSPCRHHPLRLPFSLAAVGSPCGRKDGSGGAPPRRYASPHLSPLRARQPWCRRRRRQAPRGRAGADAWKRDDGLLRSGGARVRDDGGLSGARCPDLGPHDRIRLPTPPPSGSGLPLLLSVQAHLLAVPGRGDTTSFSPTVSPLSFHSPPLPSI